MPRRQKVVDVSREFMLALLTGEARKLAMSRKISRFVFAKLERRHFGEEVPEGKVIQGFDRNGNRAGPFFTIEVTNESVINDFTTIDSQPRGSYE
ncbi:hypothetical protein KW783_03510 [Candidatus Parcubacteria bacterium]|nr:hypothetical protein [Candidatus Parcubacteria bacterium]